MITEKVDCPGGGVGEGVVVGVGVIEGVGVGEGIGVPVGVVVGPGVCIGVDVGEGVWIGVDEGIIGEQETNAIIWTIAAKHKANFLINVLFIAIFTVDKEYFNPGNIK
jgi:hypothetical protein